MRGALAVLLGATSGLAGSSCGERKAREACEEFYDRYCDCGAIECDPYPCDDVEASDRELYDCLNQLDNVCSDSARAMCD